MLVCLNVVITVGGDCDISIVNPWECYFFSFGETPINSFFPCVCKGGLGLVYFRMVYICVANVRNSYTMLNKLYLCGVRQ